MSAAARTRRAIEAAWHAFIADGDVHGCVRPEIRRSWERVRRESQVHPGLLAPPSAPGDVLARAEEDEAYRIASPLVRDFAGRLAAEGHVVGYFDAGGVMLSLEGNHRSRRRLESVNFSPGACWAEAAAGTNGPGTALAEGRALEVFASEHFVAAWQPWTCASVPVRSRGRVVGVVDITSPWDAHHAGLLITAEALARAVEGQLDAAQARSALAATSGRAAAALGARDEFLALASHELRTPLTPLQLRLQCLRRMAERSGEALDPADVAFALRRAEDDLHRVVASLDALIDSSAASRDEVELAPEPTDLGAVARRAVARHGRELARRGCAVALRGEREVVGLWDGRWLEQALDQLLVNAMTYAPGRIEVAIDRDAARARVAVRDEGRGVPEQDRERIFGPFERAVGDGAHAGFGLGLHLVRRIAEAHGGGAWVESTPGRGSVFVVELPLPADATRDAAAAP
jgi:sigma-54 dependent transcriptional regulator, acetoin dehydrogenase operon transcriptional activator AcoR